ncbi:uncharacterized protein LOC101455858 [Ceratitis capitata]|uniref:(Mediterranean fruit fly) hypothetical protein n=1 Tax=Ceratitis capitata TaxID=7213 RepID=W8B864_CERCA|nr:uncharacterized protein LOC101455858 [Ceratitis capitata]CAD6996732.1 unnamed protein product [Ceratitis capitata]
MSNCDTESVDENQPPPSNNPSTSSATGEDVEVVPKHLRSRYWNSWEEMRLVELWRLYCAEVTTLKINVPIFRTIAEGMREYGFLVNAQEVRRKMNNFKNKYIAERRSLELDGNKKQSDWRLYPLVHCLLAPRQKNQLLTHQKLIINQLFSKIPADVLNKELPFSERLADKTKQQSTSFTSKPVELLTLPTQSRYQPRHQPYAKTFGNYSSTLLRHKFTKEKLTQLIIDNSILSDQRDTALKHLKAEERSFAALESFLLNWEKKHETTLQSLQCTGGE